MPAPHQLSAAPGASLTEDQVRTLVAQACPAAAYRDRRICLIIPDGTRTAPVGLMFKSLFAQLGGVTKKFDVMIALGTHPAMPDDAINARVEISASERASTYRSVEFINHEWNNPAALRDLGAIPAEEIKTLSGGLFAMDVPVHINRRVFDYDQLIIVGPVFPHEVVGFSGGNKYLF
ncbi:MAG: hypothetical protein C0518_12845, partial [Opitutus sp.]|nr:hypothetical protein [Opitutus sp.]